MLPGGIGGLLILVGAVWLLQGVGLLPGSFMTGSTFWAVIGSACLAAGLGMVIFGVLRKRRSQPPPP
jgi:hypothetical protein